MRKFAINGSGNRVTTYQAEVLLRLGLTVVAAKR
jgi:hypothetical protein